MTTHLLSWESPFDLPHSGSARCGNNSTGTSTPYLSKADCPTCLHDWKAEQSEHMLRQEAFGLLDVPAPRFSATTVKMAQTCLRKYWYPYVAGLGFASTAAQSWGTDMHKQLELWLLHAKQPDPKTPQGKAAINGLGFLPAPRAKGLHVEHSFALKTRPGLPYFTGTRDYWVEEAYGRVPIVGGVENGFGFSPGIPLLGDHKSTASFQYALTQTQLEHDVQAGAYAKGIVEETGAEEVYLRWSYYEKKSARVRVTEGHLDLTKVDRTWQKVTASVAEMDELVKEQPSLHHVPKNTDECGKFGGCPYLSRCFGSGPSRSSSVSKSLGVNASPSASGGLFERLSGSPENKSATEKETKRTEKWAKMGVADMLAQAGVEEKPKVEKTEEKKPEAKAAAAPKPTNNKSKYEALFGAVAEQEKENKLKETGADKEPEVAVNPPDAPAPDLSAAPPEAPKASKAKTKKVSADQLTLLPPQSEQTTARPARQFDTAKVIPGLIVFIGSMPIKGFGGTRPVNFSELVADLEKEVADGIGREHWRLAEYSTGDALLASRLDRYLDENPITGTVMVDKSSKSALACLDVLVRRAEHAVDTLGR